MDYRLPILICLYGMLMNYIGYRMGRSARVIEVKENQTVRYLEEPCYQDEDAVVPDEQV